MAIRLDSTKISTVVRCTRCPWWHGFADSPEQGLRVGVAHEDRSHADTESNQVRNTLHKRKTRRAAKQMIS